MRKEKKNSPKGIFLVISLEMWNGNYVSFGNRLNFYFFSLPRLNFFFFFFLCAKFKYVIFLSGENIAQQVFFLFYGSGASCSEWQIISLSNDLRIQALKKIGKICLFKFRFQKITLWTINIGLVKEQSLYKELNRIVVDQSWENWLK